MPFARPSLATLLQRCAAELAQRLGLGALLERGPLRVLSALIAGQSHAAHGFADWVSRQIIPDTADPENLERWADLWGVARKAAGPADGFVHFTGTNGTVIPPGLVVQRADGVQYQTTAPGGISGGVANVAVEALVGGATGNADIGTPLQLVSPLAGLATNCTVADDGSGRGITGGSDTESDADLRARLKQRVQNTPNGGSVADFERWALEVSGVTRAWVRREPNGPGSVGVWFVLDDDPISIIPATPKIDEVFAHIDPLRPAGMAADGLIVAAPVALPLDPNIQLTPSTAAVKAAVQAALEDLLRREASLGDPLLLSHINEAISDAAGEADHVLVSPVADVTALPTEIHVLGTITWS